MPEEFIEDIISAADAEQTQPEETSTQVEESPSNVEVTNNEETSTASAETTNVETPNSGEVNPVEELATKLGWSKEHTGDSFVDAETYILRSREIQDSMRDHNRDLKAQLNGLQDSVEALKIHNERVYKAEVTKLQAKLDKLNNDRDAAIELADKDAVKQLDGQIEAVKKNLSEPVPQPKTTSSNPVYDDWVKDNQWYVTDKDMAVFADNVAQQYVGAPADRVYSLVRQKVAEVWPEKFETTKPVKQTNTQTGLQQVETTSGKANPIGPTSPVESPTNAGVKPSFTKADLTSDQQAIMNQFVRQGIMTEAQYIADIAKLQEA